MSSVESVLGNKVSIADSVQLLEESLLFTRFKMTYKLFHGEVFLQSSVTISVVKIIGIAIH